MAKKTEYELLINIGAQVNKSVESSISSVTGLLKKAFGAKIIWDGVTALGSKVVEIGAESVEMYSELETSVVRAANVFGGTREEVEAVENQIKSLAITTSKEMPYAASEVSDSLYYLGQVGLTFEESADVMDDMLKLAYADGQDVATVVDLVTDSMSNLQMEINKSNVNEYMNQIAEVMASTNTSAMGALETIMGFGGTSNLLGSNIQEVSALLGVLANVGIKGTEAGTALNSMMTRMIGGTAKSAYDKLGVSLYDDAGAFRGYAEVLKDVNEQIAKLTDQQRDPIMKTMFGVHYMNEGQALLNSMTEAADGSSEYSKILERQYAVSDRLEQMYQNQTDTLGAQTKIFQNNLDVSKLILGDAIAPALTEVLNWANRTLFPELEDGTNALGQYIQTNITPNIGGWLDEGYTYVTEKIDDLKTYFSSPEWTGLAESAGDLGANVVNGLLSADWDAVFEAAGNIGKATASISTFIINLSNAAVEIAEGPLGTVVGWFADYYGKAAEGINLFFSELNRLSDPGTESDNAFTGYVKQSEKAKNEAELYEQQIEAVKQAMAEETDSKQLKIYQGQIDELNAKMQTALENYRLLQQGAQTLASEGSKVPSVPNASRSAGTANLRPFADGGIVTRPTIGLIGEAGEKEAVIPLSKLGSVVGQLTGGGNITYTQVVHINGSANPDEVKQAMSQSYAEFKANWQRLQKEQKRAAF